MNKKMHTVASWLTEKSIKSPAFEEMDAEAKAKVYNELNENNVAAFKELQEAHEKGETTAEELQKALDEMEKTRAEQIQKIFAAMEKQGLALQKLMKAGVSPEGVTIKSELEANTDEVKSILTGGSTKEIAIKALSNRASVENAGNFQITDVGQIGHREINMYNLFPKISISGDNTNGTVEYYDWDEATTVRAANMVAEGAAFPESTAKFKRYTLTLRKVGDSIPVTEEFIEDESRFASELEMFLTINVDIKIDEQLLTGDGTGENLIGLQLSAPAYVPVASGITDASIYDLLVKVREDITTNKGSKYSPNFAILNISDINKMKLKKDANNNYVMPPFVTRDGQEVAGMVVIENNGMAANSAVVGDRRYGRIYEVGGFTIARGLVNNQFLEDTITIKVRKRLGLLVREADKSGFREITDIDAALVTLAT